MLELNVRKRRSNFTLAADVRLGAGASGLFGPSGAGKTSLLNFIAGLEAPDEGRIRLDDVVLWDDAARINLAPERRAIGYIFQDARLFPHLTVRSNLLYGVRARRAKPNARTFDAVVQLLGIERLLTRRPRTLSGGEKQRVAIGRAVLSAPKLLLMDEPLASLDATRRVDILGYIRRLLDELPIAMLYVSHTAEEIAVLAREVVVLSAGRVMTVGSPDDVLLIPEGERNLQALMHSTLVTARVAERQPDPGLTLLEHGCDRLKVARLSLPAGTRVALRIHARNVVVARGTPAGVSIRNVLPGRIARITAVDATNVEVAIDIGPELLAALITRDALADLRLQPGEEVFALIKANAIESATRD